SRALERDVQAGEVILAECTLYRGLDPQEHAERSVRPWVTADVTATVRQAGDIVGRTRDLDHVRDIHPDVFGSHVTPPEPVDRLSEGVKEFRGLGPALIG